MATKNRHQRVEKNWWVLDISRFEEKAAARDWGIFLVFLKSYQ
jgi:hypothetical protein